MAVAALANDVSLILREYFNHHESVTMRSSCLPLARQQAGMIPCLYATAIPLKVKSWTGISRRSSSNGIQPAATRSLYERKTRTV